MQHFLNNGICALSLGNDTNECLSVSLIWRTDIRAERWMLKSEGVCAHVCVCVPYSYDHCDISEGVQSRSSEQIREEQNQLPVRTHTQCYLHHLRLYWLISANTCVTLVLPHQMCRNEPFTCLTS